jgi:2-hydroxychromene-2-carboxylate isomerase
VAAVAKPLGVDPVALKAACDDPGIKDKLRLAVEATMARGVFGSPYIIVDSPAGKPA